MRVLAADGVLAVLDDLMDAWRTQGELVTRHFDGRSGKASETLGMVESLGLIARPGGKKQPYVLVHAELTKRLLVIAAELAHALSSSQADADAALLTKRRAAAGEASDDPV